MNELSVSQLNKLNKDGYLVIERDVKYEQLSNARNAADRVKMKCINTDYPNCRADNRLSDQFIEKIDNVFCPELFEKELLLQTVNSPALQYAKQVLGTADIYLAFQRLHTTEKYSAYSCWHRDAPADGKFSALKISIPLFNEVGFYVIPGSHKEGDLQIDNGTCDSTDRSHYSNEVRIAVKAGDILLFHCSLLHRGTCPGRTKYKRAHLHFNFIRDNAAEEFGQVQQDYLSQPYITKYLSNDWKVILDKSVPQHYPITCRHKKANVLKKFNQLIACVYYYTSFIFPRSFSESSPQWLVGFYKCPKKYRSYFKGI